MVESKQRHHRPIDLLVNFLVVVVVDLRQEERLVGADDAGDRSMDRSRPLPTTGGFGTAQK